MAKSTVSDKSRTKIENRNRKARIKRANRNIKLRSHKIKLSNESVKRSWKKRRYNKVCNIFRILGIFLAFLLIANFARRLNSGTMITFQGLLDWLGTVDSMPLNVKISNFGIFADWGIFNGIRDFLNLFVSLFGVLVYMGANLINLFIFAGQFLAFIFV